MALPEGSKHLGVLRAVSLLGGVAIIVFDIVLDLMAPLEPDMTPLRMFVGFASLAYFVGTFLSEHLRRHGDVWILLLVALFTGSWLYNCYVAAFSFPITITLFNVVLACSLVFKKPRVIAIYLTGTMLGMVLTLLLLDKPAVDPTIMLTAFSVTCGLCYFVLGSWLRSQEAVQHNEDVLYKTQALAQVGGWTLLGRRVELSENATKLLGLSEVVARDWTELQQLLDPESNDNLELAVASTKHSGQGFDIEIRLRHFDHRQQWLRVLGEVDRGPQRLLRGMIQDISRQKQHELELIHAKDVAEQALATRSRFLANMSHEIRTPMNGVIGMASMLRETDLSSEQEDMAETVYNSGTSLLTIINDILDFSKIDAGHIELEEAPFDVRSVFQHTMNLFAPPAAEKDLTFHCSVEDRVPQSLIGDETRLRQVLSNLLANAVKFTESGGVHVDAKGSPWGAAAYDLEVIVKDTGIGIPEEQQSSLFDAFTQADVSTTRLYGGTGLGLSISRHLVELMGGKLTVLSAPTQGSAFSFTVRFAIAQRTQASETPNSDLDTRLDIQASEINGIDPGVRILLVEDNPVNQKVAVKMLERLGFTADLASNGLEALLAAKSQSYDLVLMDVQMPVMDGLTATRRIRAESNNKQPYILAMTANAMRGDAEQYLAAGMNSHLAKPVTLDKMRSALLEFGSLST